MTRHFKHLLGRYKIGQAKNAVEHARHQFETLMKRTANLNDNWVEIQVVLFDTEKE